MLDDVLTVLQKSERKFTHETPLGRKRRARRINRVLARVFPNARTELDFETPFQLLIATVLSAQTTDIRVNEVTPELFAAYPDPQALGAAHIADVEAIIRPTGFFRSKAKNIVALSAAIADDWDGRVPETQAGLVTLPGVGVKTANVVLGNAFDTPGLTVDTHVARMSQRLGFTRAKDPAKIEADVAALFPAAELTLVSHRLIFLGRRICHAKRPACGVCPITALCPSFGLGELDPQKAAKLLGYGLTVADIERADA